MSGKTYLGDSVYADFNTIVRGDVILTTENGHGPTNSIYLEPEVLDEINRRRRRAMLPREPPPVTNEGSEVGG